MAKILHGFWVLNLIRLLRGFSFKPNYCRWRNDSLVDSSDINGDGNSSNEPFAGTVDLWKDKSGNLNHAGNGNGPSVQPNRWNNLNTLRFDRSSNSELPVRMTSISERKELFCCCPRTQYGGLASIISKRGRKWLGFTESKHRLRGTTLNFYLTGMIEVEARL